MKIGNKVGKWTLLKEIKHDETCHDTRFECQCDCGNLQTVRRYCLKNNRSTQCRSCARTKHGWWKTPTYTVWEGMIKRCSNPKTTHYKYYGGRGISVCERWSKFENFLSDMGERPEGLQLDRTNNNGNYESNNCKWITKAENMRNTRRAKKAT